MAQKKRIGLAQNKCCFLNVTCCGFRFSTKVRDKARRDIRDRTGEGSFVSSSVASEVMVSLVMDVLFVVVVVGLWLERVWLHGCCG